MLRKREGNAFLSYAWPSTYCSAFADWAGKGEPRLKRLKREAIKAQAGARGKYQGDQSIISVSGCHYAWTPWWCRPGWLDLHGLPPLLGKWWQQRLTLSQHCVPDTCRQPGASLVAPVVKNPLANAGDARNMGPISASERSHGGGHGNSLQYSCLENPMDRGAWWATVHGVTKSMIQWKHLSIAHRQPELGV